MCVHVYVCEIKSLLKQPIRPFILRQNAAAYSPYLLCWLIVRQHMRASLRAHVCALVCVCQADYHISVRACVSPCVQEIQHLTSPHWSMTVFEFTASAKTRSKYNEGQWRLIATQKAPNNILHTHTHALSITCTQHSLSHSHIHNDTHTQWHNDILEVNSLFKCLMLPVICPHWLDKRGSLLICKGPAFYTVRNIYY